ncbi:MAG: hypothetical protein ACR2P3_06665, partial [Geminicoccaceae bacterium]
EQVILAAFIPGTEPKETTPEDYDTYNADGGAGTSNVENQTGLPGQVQPQVETTAPRAGGLY